jgi:hypothetical protein
MRVGQRLPVPATLGAPLTVNHVAVFAQRQGLGGTDRLVAELVDEATKGVVASAVVMEPAQGVTSRAHWFGGALSASVGLLPGRSYYLLLRSDGEGKNPLGFALPVLRSTLKRDRVLEDPTWGGAGSHLVVSPDGGQSFFSSAGRPDMPLLLADRAELAEPLAIYDEGGVYHADDTAALTAAPGEPLRWNFVVRNIGGAPGALYYQLVDVDTGDPLTEDPVVTTETAPNADAQGVGVVLPAPRSRGPWRVDVRCGHLTGGGQPVFDDVVRFEVRVV